MIMKKFLLIAVAALFVGSANAQVAKQQPAGKPQASSKSVMPQATFKQYQVAPAKQVTPVLDKTSKQFQVAQSVKATLAPAKTAAKMVETAGTVQPEYEGIGNDMQEGAVSWSMYSGTDQSGTMLLLQDVIPDPFGFENGVVVEYTMSGNNIVIAPQLVASSAAQSMYVFLESATSADGTITLTMDNSGNITGTYQILYGAYSSPAYDFDEYLGYYSYVQNVKYSLPGVVVAPTVSFEPNSLVLFAGIGLNGYQFQSNLGMTSAYAPVSFTNLTTDKATAWQWSASDYFGEEVATGSDKDFEFNTVGGEAYTNIQLVGTNQTAVSEPFTFGAGNSFDDLGEPNYEQCILYAGSLEDQFILNGETNATITRQNPDGDLIFYTNWGTPDKYSTSMTKIYNYFEKPAAPLYIEGVTLPLVGATFNSDFNLHIKICEATYTGSRMTIGDVIAEGNATIENVNQEFSVGLSGVEFSLYTEDELGWTVPLDYLFIDTEFCIIIEDWDNGTFSGTLGSQDAPLDNARTSTWFEKSGPDEAGKMYSYTSWKTSLLIGLKGAAMGYLNTEDDTNITFGAAGGQAAIHVEPMLCNVDATGESRSTRLWMDDSSDAPEWLKVGFANENYDTEYSFDLVFEAEALPEGEESRSANIVLVQEGAKLVVTVTQDANGTGVSKVTTVKADGKAYNVVGQRVSDNFRGIVVKDGKKVIR